MRKTRIWAAAKDFRAAMEAISWPSGGYDLGLDRFPHGCCGNVSPMLGTFLQERGLGEFQLVEGTRGTHGQDFTSHAWLCQLDLIVDITADQFPEIADKVIVTTESSWYRSFAQQPGYSGDYRDLGNEELSRRMGTIYELILAEIENHRPRTPS